RSGCAAGVGMGGGHESGVAGVLLRAVRAEADLLHQPVLHQRLSAPELRESAAVGGVGGERHLDVLPVARGVPGGRGRARGAQPGPEPGPVCAAGVRHAVGHGRADGLQAAVLQGHHRGRWLMANLVDLLLPDTPLHLLQGQVFGTAGGGTYVHITWGAGVIYNAGAFDGASFTVGDYVWFLLSDEAGALVLGKQTPGTHDTSTPPAGTPLIVSATSYATYDQVAGTWTASTLVQSPTSFACWFYSTAAFSTVAGMPWSAFELELPRTAGGPPEIGPHLTSAGSGVFVTDGDRWVRDQPP